MIITIIFITTYVFGCTCHEHASRRDNFVESSLPISSLKQVPGLNSGY